MKGDCRPFPLRSCMLEPHTASWGCKMTSRIVASLVVIFLPLSAGTSHTRAQAANKARLPGGGRWSVGLYSTRDYLERNGPHALLDLAVVRDELRVTKAQ